MFRDYVIRLPEIGREIYFVDREVELAQLEQMALHGYVFPVAIYGPEGCGKTTLLRCFFDAIRRRNGNTVAIYIDALEENDIRRALHSSIEELWNVVEVSLQFLPVGTQLARSIVAMLRKLHEKVPLRGKNVVVIVDDVYRAIGLENVDRYTKSLYESIDYLHRYMDVGKVLILLTTSEGVSKRELHRHTYVHVYMLWNLPREGFEELVQQLEPPRNIDTDTLWRLTGGNPRALIELARLGWSIGLWRARIFEDRIRRVLNLVDRDRLKSLAEDPDSDWRTAELLEEMGLMIELKRVLVLGRAPDPDPELGIGRDWAWQLPVYRDLLLEALRR